MEDQIRQSRLNRFAQIQEQNRQNAATASPSASDAAGPVPVPSEPSGDSITAPVPTPATTTVPQMTASSGDRKSSPRGDLESNPGDDTEQDNQSDTHAEGTPDKTPPAPRAASTGAWYQAMIFSVLKVSLAPKEGYLHLSSLADDLGPKDACITPDSLDSVIWEALTVATTKGDSIEYLMSSWERSLPAGRQVQALPERAGLVAQLRRSLAQYAVVCATASPDEEIYGDLPARLIARNTKVPWDFMEALVDGAVSQDLLEELVSVIFDRFRTTLLNTGMSGEYVTIFALTDNLLAIKPVTSAVVNLPCFPIPDGAGAKEIVSHTLLGPYFAISPLAPDYVLTLFPGIQSLSSMQISNIVKDAQPETALIMDRLFLICNRIIRGSPANRQPLLNYFAGVLDRNHKRTAMQVDPAAINNDGFMANMSYVCVKFCEPFVDPHGKKLNKIDPEYYRCTVACDISEETKLIASLPESKEWLETDRRTEEPNFITQIFFLTVGFLHYGLSAIVQSASRLKRLRDNMQSQRNDVDRLIDRFRNTPQGAAAEMIRSQVGKKISVIKAQLASLNCVLGHEDIMLRFYEFAAFTFMFAVHEGMPDHKYPAETMNPLRYVDAEPPMVYKCYPEYLVEAPVQTFIHVGCNLPQITRTHVHEEVIEGVVFFLRCPQFVHNPYLKSKMVEILFYGGAEQPLINGGSIPGYFVDMYNSNKTCLDHLFHALMKLYIDMEQTGRSTQFYDKFNTRELISLVMKTLWNNSTYRQNLENESRMHTEFFVRFVALLLNDATYLLDEALGKLQDIHRLQTTSEDGPSPNHEDEPEEGEEEGNNSQARLASAEREAKLYLQLSRGTVELLGTFTTSTPVPFVTPEIVDRLASMLNYNLTALVGPKCRELVVKTPEKYGFKPRELLSDLVRVYLNLEKSDQFVTAVARDGRSYSLSNFERADSILTKWSLLGHEQLLAWRLLKDRTEEVRRNDEAEDEEMGDVPDEFLDPLMFTIMENPVILPASKMTIDMSTIKAHLLSDPIDPFNRVPLKLEDVVPNTELKEQIDEFRRQKKSGK